MSLNRENILEYDVDNLQVLVDYIGVGKFSSLLLRLYKKSAKDLMTKGGLKRFDRLKEKDGIEKLFDGDENIAYFFYDILISNRSQNDELWNILEGRLRKRLGLDTRDMSGTVSLDELEEAFKKEKTDDEMKNIIYPLFGYKDKVKEIEYPEEEESSSKESFKKEKLIKHLEVENKRLEKENESLRQSKEAADKVKDTNKAKLKDLRDKLKNLANVALTDDVDETVEKKEKTFEEAFKAKLFEIEKAVEDKDYASAKEKLVTLFIEISLEEKA